MKAELDTLELKIKSNARTAAKGIDKLTESLNALKNVSKDSAGLESLNKEAEHLKNTFSKVKLGGSGLDSLKSQLNAGVLIVGLKKITDQVGEFVKKSTAYVETLNLFTVAMGDYAESAREYANEVAEIMGIDPAQWMQGQSVFMTLATGFGVTSDRASKMSKNLTQLGYDLSSFFNISVEDAMQKLQSGLSGELEPLRRLGYDLSQAKLEAIALSLGIDKSVSSMTQAEKAELRYHAILTQVTTAQGDMARTLEQPANQLRLLEAAINQAGRAIGNIFIPMMNRILPTAIAVVKVVEWVASTIASVFGFTMSGVDYSAFDSLANGASDAEEAISGATGAAKELQRQVMGFDELNILSKQSAGGGGGAGLSGSGFDFELEEYDFLGNAVASKANEIAKTIKEKIGPSVERLKENIKSIYETARDVAVAFAAFTITNGAIQKLKSVVDLLSLGRKDLDGWQKATKIVAGLTVAISGIQFSYEAGFDLGGGSTALMDVVKAILGPVVAGIGGMLIASTFGFGGVGFAIGLSLGVIFEIVGYFKGQEESLMEKYQQSEFGQQLAELDAEIANGIARTTELRVRIEKITGEVDEQTIANFEMAKQLIDEIFVLDADANKTSAEIELINEKIEILNGLGLEGIALSFDKTTEHVTQTKESVLATMDALLQQYKIEALRDSYIESYKAQYQATSDVTKAQNELSKAETASAKATGDLTIAQSSLKKAEKELNEFLDKNSDSLTNNIGLNDELIDTYNTLTEGVDKANEQVNLARKAQEQATEEIDKAKEHLGLANVAYNEATEKVGELEEALINLSTTSGKETENFVKNGENMMAGLEQGLLAGGKKAEAAIETTNANMQRITEVSNDMNSPSVVYKDYGINMMAGLEIGLKEGWDKIKSWWKSLTLEPFHIQVPHFNIYWDYNLLPTTQKVASQVYGVAALPSMNVSWYAKGGYGIPNGQLFVANEAGPELVGQMNGKNTVANQGQIVEGIRQATYEGFMAAMASNNNDGNDSTFVFQVGEDVFAQIVTKSVNKQTRELGYLALEGI